MKRNWMIVLACCVLAAFALGAVGTARFSDDAAPETPQQDCLIGVLITRQPLDTLAAGDSQGRLYAAHTGREYVFPDVDGMRLFAPQIHDEHGPYRGTVVDAGVSDVVTHFYSAEQEERMSLEGTVYVSASQAPGNVCYYLNPVYQTSGGEVYSVPGSGISVDFNAVEGSMSQKLSETQTGTAGDGEGTTGAEIEITVCPVAEPTNIAVLQFDGQNALLAREDYLPGQLPEALTALSDTQYIIVESVSEASVTRTLFQPGEEALFAFYDGGDGVCVKQTCEVEW